MPFDVWYSETSLYENGKIDQALETLREKGHVYEEDGATWFRSTTFGDDKDRVLIKKTAHTLICCRISHTIKTNLTADSTSSSMYGARIITGIFRV